MYVYFLLSKKLETKQKFKYHFYFWLAYFLFEINAEFIYLHELFKQFSLGELLYFSVISEFTFLLAEIPAFYIILWIIDGKVNFLQNKFQKIIAVLFAFVFFVVLYRVLCHDLVYPYYYNVPEDISRFSRFGIFNAVMNVIFSVAIALGFEKFIEQNETKKQLAEISKEKSNAELKFLKSQINPHFLFNSLNNIYGLALKKSDETPEVILQLSKIMRYNIYDAAKERVTIKEEVDNIKDFIEIHKIRHHQLQVDFEEHIENPSQEISPLILIQFVENAFKYGVSESLGKSYIKIFLELKYNILHYQIENSKENTSHSNSTLGLKNIKRQLELLYPNHVLEINDHENKYQVHLKIDFNHEQKR